MKSVLLLLRKNVLYSNRFYSSAINEVVSSPLRSKKPKSTKTKVSGFVDVKQVQAIGGKGGDGCISFLSLWANEFAGPDGGDGGSGGHIILQACSNTSGLNHVDALLKGEEGRKGSSSHCHGKNAEHTIIKVPVGTIVKNSNDKQVGDLSNEGTMFILARGGAGGHGNHFFTSATNQSPAVAECGADGENISYTIELRSMAHFGLLGFPNAGKSTLLQAISRARPKIAPYPFTTKQPYLGVVQYSDYEQICVADLPGIIEGSHKNRGLGIQFLRHVQRCTALIIMVDIALDPWNQVEKLRYELEKFNKELSVRPQLIVANKMDLEVANDNLEKLKEHFSDEEIIPISAKCGTNLLYLLQKLRNIYDSYHKET
ncbi:mitochondrial ribosome-associated GTPase 2 [Lycorma delicatula]|uniref:mitochondrial ribosome-associated GTPase 2 n=1 Tax=Lycorma delicatula TaxID=130591 RepID=UPI003F514E7F